MYRNKEGYADPTAMMAVGEAMRDYKKKQKAKWMKKNQPKGYVVSKYAGDVDKNVANAIKACQYLMNKNIQPIASHLMYPCMLDDDVPEQRELGLLYGLSLLAISDEVYVFTDADGVISSGMEQEIRESKRLHKPIHYVSLEVI